MSTFLRLRSGDTELVKESQKYVMGKIQASGEYLALTRDPSGEDVCIRKESIDLFFEIPSAV